MRSRFSAFLPTLLLSALFGTASAYTVDGTVTNANGNPISGASVSLLKEGKITTTDAAGKFTLHDDETVLQSTQNMANYLSIRSGVLSFSQNGSSPVQIKIFDLVGNQLLNQTLYGSGKVDLRSGVDAKGAYVAQVTMGSVKQNIRFTANGNYASRSTSERSRAFLKAVQQGETLQFSAEGYEALSIPLGTLDTTVNVQLTEKKLEQTYAFGYAMGNAPTPSRGCGKVSSLQPVGSNSNANKYSLNSAGLTREYWVTLPKNYDNTKPYKILFANHCMGSNAEDFTNHTPDQDHPSPYYGQQELDTENNYIFVAPRGDTDGMPWRMGDDKDHVFFGDLLTLLEDNYCIDTSRVFVTGFSFGSMYSNSLAQDFQHRIRAVVTYAVANWNIYLPQNAGKPIAWMDVHGMNDDTCPYYQSAEHNLANAIKAILKNNGPDGTDVSDEINQMETYSDGNTHVCYSFKKVDPRFPVQVCTWGGGHQWTAYDNGNWQNTWVPKKVKEFIEQF